MLGFGLDQGQTYWVQVFRQAQTELKAKPEILNFVEGNIASDTQWRGNFPPPLKRWDVLEKICYIKRARGRCGTKSSSAV